MINILGNGGGKRLVLSANVAIYLTLFIDAIGSGMIIPLLPFYAATFNAGSTALGILIASFALMQFLFSPMLGKLSDSLGRKRVLIFSLIVSIASLLLFSFASSFIVLLFSRIVAGLATERSVAQAYIVDHTNEEERSSILGRAGAFHGLGYIIGPAFGGTLSGYGFTTLGLIATGLTFINLLFVLTYLSEHARQGVTNTPSSEPLRNALKQVSLGVLFKKIFEAFTSPQIGVVLIFLSVGAFSFSMLPVIIPLLGISYYNFGSREMSYFFVYLGVVQILLQGLVIGKLAKKLDEGKMIVVSSVLMILGMLVMPLFTSIGIFILALTIMALSTGILRTAVPSLISKMVPSSERGGAMGLTSSVESVSTVPGSLIGGMLIEYFGLASPFFICAFLALGVLLLFGKRLFK